MNIIKQRTIEHKKENVNAENKCSEEILSFWIIDEFKPALTKYFDNGIKTIAIPIAPKSLGLSNLARDIPIKNPINWVQILPRKSQRKDLYIYPLKILNVYCPKW